MRLLPVSIALGLGFATMSTSVSSQRADDQIAPLSVDYQRRGEALTASRQFPAAIDALETALVVDPRNRGAYSSLARVAYAQGLYGKAIKLYGEVLAIEPNDLAALAGQGEAMVQRGAVERARVNLDRIRKLCTSSCPQEALLTGVIAKGPPPALLAAQARLVPPPPNPSKPQ